MAVLLAIYAAPSSAQQTQSDTPPAGQQEKSLDELYQQLSDNSQRFLDRVKVTDTPKIIAALRDYSAWQKQGIKDEKGLLDRYFGRFANDLSEQQLAGLQAEFEQMGDEYAQEKQRKWQELLEAVGATGQTPDAMRKRAALIFIEESPLMAIPTANYFMNGAQSLNFAPASPPSPGTTYFDGRSTLR